MVPWFIVCRNMLHLTDTIWALILPYVANAWYIFLVRNYYRGIPDELVEAAKIDGAGEYRIFYQIIFPLSKPVLATIALFACLAYWNDWWLGIMLIDKVEMQPLQLLLRTYFQCPIPQHGRKCKCSRGSCKLYSFGRHKNWLPALLP